MPIGITDSQEALREATEGFFARAAPVADTRGRLETLGRGGLPPSWPDVVDQGLLAVHLPETVGGGGGTVLDLAVVLEAAGRTLFPGPLLPCVLASAVVSRALAHGARDRVLGALAGGAVGAAALDASAVRAEPVPGGFSLHGRAEAVLGLPGAQFLVVGATADGGREIWAVLDTVGRPGVTVTPGACTDLTRGIGSATLDAVALDAADVLAGVETADVRFLSAVLFAAEAVGAARWCLTSVLDYVRHREAFGRVVGSFQAVKHRCARIFVACEKLTASAWDGARAADEPAAQQALAAASTAATCLDPARDVALEALTLFGGIGFTWEHDVHLYWRRCLALAQLLGPRATWERAAGRAATDGPRDFSVQVPVDDGFRRQVRDRAEGIAALPAGERRREMADAGLVSPQYPPPYGLSASPGEQLAVTEELRRAGLEQPHLIIGEWALPTIIAHGTEAQRERFVPPTLRGELVWCQLFSEPGAGSDLAALTTRAERADGGWVLNGQKVWTSLAHLADWGLCLARTDPAVPKHQGISYFLVDMAAPGVEVRPLRQSTGEADFNEVFLTDVLVPDDCVVGEVNAGWRLAQTTLGNERVRMAGLAAFGPDPVRLATAAGLSVDDDDVARELGAMTAERICLVAMSTRALLRRAAGHSPGAESSVLKLAGAWHQLASAATALAWAGPAAVAAEDGPGADAVGRYMRTPTQLLGGGTSEIQLNVIAERVLGLPRR